MMDRTAAARMRRYRVRVSFRAMVKRAFAAGVPMAELVEIVESTPQLRGDRHLIDTQTAELFERNVDLRYGECGRAS
ncbi:MAG: hypothetical protein A3F74_15960 [Betaproteobacteria bacterium RIFCSPLOWO2_12_FULL_62_58]|nr:MAG: hypothetical protein A3I62_03990 [Betaproteobacteria bacterium RIFCSPLOWO2_02_FULL_62_79]OGA51803.1 MAG: hypothetical protein A3F74_15960 [Betaproteobacteria bacterium RIFCSPLOWO2_12_FULL_62_58]